MFHSEGIAVLFQASRWIEKRKSHLMSPDAPSRRLTLIDDTLIALLPHTEQALTGNDRCTVRACEPKLKMNEERKQQQKGRL